MWLMLQQDQPDDYVIATGEDAHRPRARARSRSRHAGLDWEKHVVDRPSASAPGGGRPAASAIASKAQRVLGWTAEVAFAELMAMMVDADIARHSGN